VRGANEDKLLGPNFVIDAHIGAGQPHSPLCPAKPRVRCLSHFGRRAFTPTFIQPLCPICTKDRWAASEAISDLTSDTSTFSRIPLHIDRRRLFFVLSAQTASTVIHS